MIYDLILQKNVSHYHSNMTVIMPLDGLTWLTGRGTKLQAHANDGWRLEGGEKSRDKKKKRGALWQMRDRFFFRKRSATIYLTSTCPVKIADVERSSCPQPIQLSC